MLNLGTEKISALRLGGAEIKKAYLGEQLVFGAGSGPGPSRLPEGYTEVEYIESSGMQAIDTGLRPVATLEIVLDVETLKQNESTSDQYIFYSKYSLVGSYKYNFSLGWGQFNMYGYMGRVYGQTSSSNRRSITTDVSPRKLHIVASCPNKTMTVNDSSASFSGNETVANMGTIFLLNCSPPSSISGVSARLFSCQMSTPDKPYRDFVPCVDPAGAVGLYDLVEGKFYGNAGTGAFTAGPAV